MLLPLAGVVLVTDNSAAAAPPPGYAYEEAFFRSADGTRLHADVLRPADLRPGERRPVLMVVTPYAAHGGGIPPNLAGEPPTFSWLDYAKRLRAFERGYVAVITDLRGFGGSEGCWDAGGPGEQADVKAAVEWAASQPWSSGKVALAGGSYDGWTGIMALATQPRGLAAVVAEAPIVDFYSALYDNGVPYYAQVHFDEVYATGHPLTTPSAGSSPEYFGSWLSHARPECRLLHARDIANADPDTRFWRERDLVGRAAQSDTPVFGTHGFLDFNARPNQLPAYYAKLRGGALWVGQWIHTTLIGDPEPIGRDVAPQASRFLQRALLGKGVEADGPTVAVQEAPRLRWRAETRWPPPDAENFSLPLKPGSYADRSGNCSGDRADPTLQPAVPAERCPTGVGTWTFSEPVRHETHVAGVPQLRVRASGSEQARLVALVYDVSPNGSALFITRGATRVRDGRFDIRLHPQDWRLAAGHRLGLLLSGADDSHYVPQPGTGEQVIVRSGSLSLPALRCRRKRFLAGERGRFWDQIKHPIQIDPATIQQRSVGADLPERQRSGADCAATTGAPTCLARRSPIGPRNIGRIRLRYTRARLRRLGVKPVRRTRRSYRYCVKRSRGRVTAVFSSRSRRGRVRLVATTAAGHSNRRVRVRSRAAKFRRAYPRRRRIARGLYRANRRSPRIFGVRRGRVRFIAVADRRLLRKPRALRRYLRLAAVAR